MTNPMPNDQEVRDQANQPEPTEQAEEVLVPDARNGLTPRQMVDAKLQARLGWVPRELFWRWAGRSGDSRRTFAD